MLAFIISFCVCMYPTLSSKFIMCRNFYYFYELRIISLCFSHNFWDKYSMKMASVIMNKDLILLPLFTFAWNLSIDPVQNVKWIVEHSIFLVNPNMHDPWLCFGLPLVNPSPFCFQKNYLLASPKLS